MFGLSRRPATTDIGSYRTNADHQDSRTTLQSQRPALDTRMLPDESACRQSTSRLGDAVHGCCTVHRGAHSSQLDWDGQAAAAMPPQRLCGANKACDETPTTNSFSHSYRPVLRLPPLQPIMPPNSTTHVTPTTVCVNLDGWSTG